MPQNLFANNQRFTSRLFLKKLSKIGAFFEIKNS